MTSLSVDLLVKQDVKLFLFVSNVCYKLHLFSEASVFGGGAPII